MSVRMPHTIYVLIIACMSAILQSACNDEPVDDPTFNGSDNLNRTIKFDVYHVYDFTPISDSLVPEASIKIYSVYEDLVLDYYPDASRTTDSLGHAEINGLSEDYYYIKCTHPGLGTVIDSVSTPYGTTSFVELYF